MTPLASDDPRHGTVNGYSNRRCRCNNCRAAQAAHHRMQKQLRSERLAAGVGHQPMHGRYTTYQNWMCRCVPCTKAATAMSRQYKRSAS